MRRKSASLVVIIVLPAGTFNSRRREVEARLKSGGEHFPALLLPAEDTEDGWTRTFAVSKTPAVHLIDARRKFVWKHEGEVHPDVLAVAMDEHLLAAPAPRSHPLRLAVLPGERLPDVSFQDISGEQFALRRLRGREILLNFCQAWSAPCLRELERLQGLHKQAGESGPFIVAFFGGKDAKALDEIRKRHGLSFPLVLDAGQAIARKYGVRCWPTTVSINADGCVGHVQFGIMHDHAPRADRQINGVVVPTNMIAIAAGLILVPLLDQGVKLLALRGLGPASVPLGPFGKLQVEKSRIWLKYAAPRANLNALWSAWFFAAASLAVLTSWFPSCGWFAGLLLGGSLSHALETSLRGCIIDYVSLRVWPAFNLADAAITVGALGILVQMAATMMEAI